MLMQANGSSPTVIQITDGKAHDSKACKDINIPPGSNLAIE
jgi:hypothetical protein